MNHKPEATDLDLGDPVLERLGRGADLTPARRTALLERLAPAASRAPRRRRWVIPVSLATAAAAVVVAALLLWPARRYDPIPPTAIFADLLGPVAEMETPATPAAPVQDESSPLNDMLASLWSDLEGPLAIAMDAFEAPKSLVPAKSAVPETPANPSEPRKGESE